MGRDDLSDDEPTELSEVLQDRLSAFILRKGLNPFAFVEGWKDGTIEDTAENAVLAIEAVALRSAIESPSPRAIRSLVRRPYHEK